MNQRQHIYSNFNYCILMSSDFALSSFDRTRETDSSYPIFLSRHCKTLQLYRDGPKMCSFQEQFVKARQISTLTSIHLLKKEANQTQTHIPTYVHHPFVKAKQRTTTICIHIEDSLTNERSQPNTNSHIRTSPSYRSCL